MDQRSVGVRFNTEPEEEEGDAAVRARFVSETEREGRRAASAGSAWSKMKTAALLG